MSSPDIDALDKASEALAHAYALVNMTYGDAGESFRGMNDEMQDSFLWALADRIRAARAAVAHLAELGG